MLQQKIFRIQLSCPLRKSAMSANRKEQCHPRGNYLSHLHAQPPNPDVKVEDSLLSIYIERVGFDKILSFKVKMNKKKTIIYN